MPQESNNSRITQQEALEEAWRFYNTESARYRKRAKVLEVVSGILMGIGLLVLLVNIKVVFDNSNVIC